MAPLNKGCVQGGLGWGCESMHQIKKERKKNPLISTRVVGFAATNNNVNLHFTDTGSLIPERYASQYGTEISTVLKSVLIAK